MHTNNDVKHRYKRTCTQFRWNIVLNEESWVVSCPRYLSPSLRKKYASDSRENSEELWRDVLQMHVNNRIKHSVLCSKNNDVSADTQGSCIHVTRVRRGGEHCGADARADFSRRGGIVRQPAPSRATARRTRGPKWSVPAQGCGKTREHTVEGEGYSL